MILTFVCLVSASGVLSVGLPMLQSRNARLDCADLDSMGFCQLVSSICSSGQAELPAALSAFLHHQDDTVMITLNPKL